MTSVETTQGDEVELYQFSDERPHDPDPDDPHWQESIFLFWWDEAAGIGAIHRIGHEPNTDPPTANSWNGVFTREGARFRRYERPELGPGSRLETGLAAGPSRWTCEELWRFELSDPECELDLEWSEDFVGLAHMYPRSSMGDVHADYAPQHYEASGRVRGQARLGEATYEVDALAYRDHSWGHREWPKLLAHRYFAGTVGPELTFCTLGWLAADGGISQFGLIIRDGAYSYAESVDYLTYMELDGTSHRGGRVSFRMAGGEVIALEAQLVDSVLHEHGGEGGAALSAVDSICTVEYEGLSGFGNLEITNNPKNGADRVPAVIGAIAQNGLSDVTGDVRRGRSGMSAERAGSVTHTAAKGGDTLWTTANLGEAMPGVCTPLSWSYFEHGVDWGMRHGFFDLGALRRSELDPQTLEERFVAPFFGRTALNLSLMCDLADRLPGTSAVAVQEGLLGNVPEDSPSRPVPTRYPVVALRAPWIAATAIRRTREQHARAARWYPQALAAVRGGEGSAESALLTLTQSLELIRHTLRTHLVVAMIAQPMFDAVVALASRAGRPGLESRLLSGLETDEVRLGDDLWALGHGLLTEREFLGRHGYHGPGGGLHISKPSWRADPEPLRSLLPGYAEIPPERRPRALLEDRSSARADAIDEIRGTLAAQWRPAFEAVLPLASRFIPLRELGRSTWMRLIDAGRASVEALGAHLHSKGALADPSDIRLCTVVELLRVGAPAGAEIDARRLDLEDFRSVSLPVVWRGSATVAPAAGPGVEVSELSGVAIGGGRVEGVARVVSDPSTDGFTPGEILICAATDPAWVSIFLLAAAVVTDTGGELSHGAIVARELGIPAVTNVRDASRIIRSGDRVVVDADAGTVRVVERASG